MKGSIWIAGRETTIWVDGVEIPVETDFRVGLLLWSILQDDTLPPLVRSRLFVRIAVGKDYDGADTPRQKLLLALLDFYGFAAVADGKGTDRPVLDLFADGERIVASFQAAYGIDLLHTSLHWHQFQALLRQLPPDTVLMQVIRLRLLDLRQIEDDALRHRLRQAKRAVQLPDPAGKQEGAQYTGQKGEEPYGG